MATVSEILNAAADLLEKPGAWTQGDYARDDTGLGFDERDEKGGFSPVCFCMIGAINTARGRDLDDALWGDIKKPVRAVIGDLDLAGWNDAPGRTQEEVVAALRQAARSSEGEGAQ